MAAEVESQHVRSLEDMALAAVLELEARCDATLSSLDVALGFPPASAARRLLSGLRDTLWPMPWPELGGR